MNSILCRRCLSTAAPALRQAGKNIFYGQEGRLRLLRGCDQVTDAVQVTLGPKGRVVLIDHLLGDPQVSKDGFTVARAISLEDRVENLGCTIAKSAAEKTNGEAGDGTTAAMILTRGIFREGCRAIAGGASPNLLRSGILKATTSLTKTIGDMSIPLDRDSEGAKLLEKVATVAANGDRNIGGLAAFAVKKVGPNGHVSV